MPRINFVSFTFLFAFGLGSFVGIGLALLAVALARPEDEIIESTPVAAARTLTPTPTATQTPTATPSPTPLPHTSVTLQVHIGPDEDYAILGTLAGGNEVDVHGRDSSGDWVAIEFPPGSSARGWIPANAIDGLSRDEVSGLEVLQATLIDTSPRTPIATSTPTQFEGNDGVPVTGDDPDPTSTPSPTPDGAPTPDDVPTPGDAPAPTPTPAPALTQYGPTDLAFGSVSAGSDGRVRVTVVNAGEGNVPGVTIWVAATGLGDELLTSGVLLAGDTASFRTTAIFLTGPTAVSIVIDPNGQLTDTNRSNNTRNLTLTP